MTGRAEGRGRIVMLAPAGSVGIRRYAERLAEALRSLGVPVEIGDRPEGDRLHFHLGNSTRSLLPAIARAPRPSLVTLHDVVPRDRRVRSLLTPLQRRLLEPHVVVVHSCHAAELLADAGFRGEPRVIHLATQERRLESSDTNAMRARTRAGDRPLLALAGVMRTHKGVEELLDAARSRDDVAVVLLGDADDDAMRDLLARLPENVTHLPGLPDEEFLTAIAAADALLFLRRESVGETSGPVVEAHAVGTPVAGYATGFLPEYATPQDLLLPPDTEVAGVLDAVQRAADSGTLRRIPEGTVAGLPEVAEEYDALYRSLGW